MAAHCMLIFCKEKAIATLQHALPKSCSTCYATAGKGDNPEVWPQPSSNQTLRSQNSYACKGNNNDMLSPDTKHGHSSEISRTRCMAFSSVARLASKSWASTLFGYSLQDASLDHRPSTRIWLKVWPAISLAVAPPLRKEWLLEPKVWQLRARRACRKRRRKTA